MLTKNVKITKNINLNFKISNVIKKCESLNFDKEKIVISDYNFFHVYDVSNETHKNYIKNFPFVKETEKTGKIDFVCVHDIKYELDSKNKNILFIHEDCSEFDINTINLYKKNRKYVEAYIFSTIENKNEFEKKIFKLNNGHVIENQIKRLKFSQPAITNDVYIAISENVSEILELISLFTKKEINKKLEIHVKLSEDNELKKMLECTNNQNIKILKYDENCFISNLEKSYGYVTLKNTAKCDYNLLLAMTMEKYIVCKEIYDNYEQIKYYPKKSNIFNKNEFDLTIDYIVPEYVMDLKFLDIINKSNNMFKKYVGEKCVKNKISEENLKDDILLGFNVKLEKGLSFLLRIKNEEEYTLKNIFSIYNHASEIIIIDNNSTDDTKNICKYLNNFYKKVFYYEYDIFLDFGKNPTYLNKLSTYYNWSLSKVTKYNVIKWDGDFYANQNNLKNMIERYDLYERSDKFSLWFSGLTMFYKNIINISSYYDEYRCFSKLNGFKWGDGYLCETSEFYVKECDSRIINGYNTTKNPVWLCDDAKKFDWLRKPIFIENKNYDDFKEFTLDKRCENDNNILIEFKNEISYKKKEIFFITMLELSGIGGVETVNSMLYDQLTYVGHDVRFLIVRPSEHIDNIKYYDLNEFKKNLKTSDANINFNILTFLDTFKEHELKELKNNVNLFGISHSEVSYYNDYFTKNHKYFKNIFVVNQRTFDKYISHGVTNVKLLRNVIPIKQNVKSKLYDNTKIKILFFSRSSYDKNLIMLLYAMKQLGENFVLDIYSEIDETTKYYYNLLNCKNINICNVTDNKDIYLEYDLCVLPSVSEGCSMNILESINYEIPIICTKLMSNNEIIRNELPMFDFDNIENPNSQLFICNYIEHLLILGYEFKNIENLQIVTPFLTKNKKMIEVFEKNVNEIVQKILLLTNNYTLYKTKTQNLKKNISSTFFDVKSYIKNISNIMSNNIVIIDREVS